MNSRETKDLLLIDKVLMLYSQRKYKNLNMALIDLCKAYDSVPHDWLLKCLNLFRVHKNTCSLIAQSMLYWRTTLTCCGAVLGDVEICRGMFQGDSLSPLLNIVCDFFNVLSYLLRKTNKGYCLRNSLIKVAHQLFLTILNFTLYLTETLLLLLLVGTSVCPLVLTSVVWPLYIEDTLWSLMI